MGLVTLVLLFAFVALYLSKSLDKKPEAMTSAVEKISGNLDKLALWGGAYGVAATLLTPVMGFGGGDMFIRFISNVMIMMMALPFVFNRFLPKFEEKLNPAILEEVKNFVGFITKQEKYVGYAGAVIGILLFAVLFR